MIGLLIGLLSLCNAFESEVYYAISSNKPTEWKKRGVVVCTSNSCTFENADKLEFNKGSNLWYYLKIKNVFTSVPTHVISSDMTDNIQLSLNGDEVNNIHYQVTGKGSSLTTTASIIKSSDYPKTLPEKRPPPEEEKGFFAKYWIWILVAVGVMYFFSA